MKIFFDTEFTGLHKDTTLISIGLIAEDGTTFYAELIDYDKSQIDEWIQKNVIDNLIIKEDWEREKKYNSIVSKGTIYQVQIDLNDWLKQFNTIEWVSDVCHYDFVLLIDLICGHALKMPYGKWNSACHDINQDIAEYYKIDEIEAFNKSREDIIKEFNINIEGRKHNSLYDAKVIKAIYDSIKSEVNN